MKSLIKWILFLTFIFQMPSLVFAQGKDCSCPKVTCGPCQKKVTIGKVVKFCDWGDINVCRKVICENVNFYFGCLSQQNKQSKPQDDDKPKGDLELVYDQDQPKKKKKTRAPASTAVVKKRAEKIKLETEGRIEVGNESRVVEGVTYSDLVIGEVKSFGNGFKVLHRGQLRPMAKKQKLFVGDEILNSAKDSKLSLKFDNGEVSLNVFKKSKLIVHDPHSIVGRFQPFLYLVHGGVEYTVNLKEGSFDLLAGQILTRLGNGKAGVKYEMGTDGLQVKVESFKGMAEVLKAQDLSGKSIQVAQGNFVSWVSETPEHLFTMDEKQALAGEGFITPVFEMPEQQKKMLGLVPPPKPSMFANWEKNPPKMNKQNRDVASFDAGDLCQAPAAGFQQCAWSCEGNSKGAKGCQAEKESVHCVRRMCNAAGQWGDPTAFASSYKDLCPAEGVRVGDCSP